MLHDLVITQSNSNEMKSINQKNWETFHGKTWHHSPLVLTSAEVGKLEDIWTHLTFDLVSVYSKTSSELGLFKG